MNKVFYGWKPANVYLAGNGGKRQKLDHKISFRSHSKGTGADMDISADLYYEIGGKKTSFNLLQNGDVYALVPDEKGPLSIGISHRVTGLSGVSIREIARTCGVNMEENRKHINGIVIDGAIIFPKEKIVKFGGLE